MIIKMYCIMARETLRQMQFEGKMGSQCGHAFLHAWWDAEDRWGTLTKNGMWFFKNDGFISNSPYREDDPYLHTMAEYKYGNDARKVTLVVDTVEELRDIYEWARPHMGATLVEDCGYTVFETPTITAVGLGPIPSDWTKGTRLADLEILRNEINAH